MVAEMVVLKEHQKAEKLAVQWAIVRAGGWVVEMELYLAERKEQQKVGMLDHQLVDKLAVLSALS